jgi:hypothetical protein
MNNIIKKGSIVKMSTIILTFVLIFGCLSTLSASAALGTRYSFTNCNYQKGTYTPVSITETINGGNLNGTRQICFEQVSVNASVTVTVKDKKGNVKTYSNLKNGGKFNVPAGLNTVTFKCNLPSLPYYLHTTTQYFLHYSKWYWK